MKKINKEVLMTSKVSDIESEEFIIRGIIIVCWGRSGDMSRGFSFLKKFLKFFKVFSFMIFLILLKFSKIFWKF